MLTSVSLICFPQLKMIRNDFRLQEFVVVVDVVAAAEAVVAAAEAVVAAAPVGQFGVERPIVKKTAQLLLPWTTWNFEHYIDKLMTQLFKDKSEYKVVY
jgi:hypothetical protein